MHTEPVSDTRDITQDIDSAPLVEHLLDSSKDVGFSGNIAFDIEPVWIRGWCCWLPNV